MRIEQVAAQLYTCRNLLQTPADIARTLSRLRKVGYRAVQISGMGPIEVEELNRILDGEGLVCCATHESPATILENPGAVVERLRSLRCKYTAYPFPSGIDLGDVGSVDAMIAALDKAGAVLASAGLILCYHNHHHEFRKLEGKTIFERIFEKTNPAHVQGEPDTYWVQHGGGDNVAWCRRLKGRLPLIHMKDYVVNSESKPAYCEIGAGNLDFRAIVKAAEESGCEWFIVEQDECPGDPVDSLAQSFDYISTNLCS